MTHHLVVLKKQYVDRVLHGHKTMECRLSRHRRPPFGVVHVGDLLWLKQSSGPITATATVGRVEYFHPLPEAKLANLRRRYGKPLQADAAFFDSHQQARYATFIRLSRVRRIEPFRLEKNDRHAWVVLSTPPVPSGGHYRS